MSPPRVTVVIPAYNEEKQIGATLRSVLQACRRLQSRGGEAEVIVVDNGSSDGTRAAVERFGGPVRWVLCKQRGAARARNAGARAATGDALVFLDADSRLPPNALTRVLAHCRLERDAGISSLGRLDGGVRARCWWLFWDHVRLLPLARAKAMPAFMFCTREAFERLGGFDERVAIGEEWPILAETWRRDRRRFVYDRGLVVRTSSRRMELQPLGYVRTFCKYVWAILFFSGRVRYSDRIR
jgi:glycosyltransferase involved in cell wall biosynthesis